MNTVGTVLFVGADLRLVFDGQCVPNGLQHHFGTAGPDEDVCVIGSAGGDPRFRVTLSEAEGSG